MILRHKITIGVKKMFRFNGFTQKANDAVNLAVAQASALGHNYIGSEHLLLGLASAEGSAAAVALSTRGVSAQQLSGLITKASGRNRQTVLTPEDITPCCKRILEAAVLLSKEYNSQSVGSEHILMALLKEKNSAAVMLLKEMDVDITSLYRSMCEVSGVMSNIGERSAKTSGQRSKPQPKTQMLDRFSRDLTQLARDRKLDPVIGRDKEIDRVIRILCRRSKNNPCLIGEAGVGKTAVAEGLAQRIASGEIPSELEDKRLVALDLTAVLAGTKYRGDFEERIKNILNETAAAKNVVLFIDEIHNIMGIGAAEGAIDAANIMKPQLARGEIQVIGATTFEEYRKHIEKDSALERRFQSVIIKEPSEKEAVAILKGLRDRYEAHHQLKIPDETLESAVKLSSRYIIDRFLPDKAIDLIDEAAALVKLRYSSECAAAESNERTHLINQKMQEEALSKGDFDLLSELRKKEEQALQKHSKTAEFQLSVSSGDIAELVSQTTGIEISALSTEETKQLLELEKLLEQQVIGQKEAVSGVARAIRRGRVGLRDPDRPMGSFLFLGPTGVGKTELCRALAKTLFGKAEAMIRLDMSEYMEKQSVSKLIGSPPGYVGYDDGGQLTEQVRRKPYSVVLFDEVEKAHPDVLHMLLQLLEDGRLTDAHGKGCSFKNAVVIMTSNIGARKITDRKLLGFSSDGERVNDGSVKKDVLSELKRTFKPELLNRIDEIVVFSSLEEQELLKITEKLLGQVSERMSSLGIECEFREELKKYIAVSGTDKEYGARPLRRKIQSFIEDELAHQLLIGNIAAGDDIICGLDGDKLTVRRKVTVQNGK